ncbi:hypothetical protein HC776_02330 [bacterium]|nr:hypothetical protein [bacterium]
MSTALMPILITQMAGAESSAHFSIAWVLASALQIAVANMSTSLTVEGAANQDNLDDYRRRALMGIARIVVPLAAVLLLGAPLILQVMGGEYSENATVLMQLLALSALPNIFNMVYVGLARVQTHLQRHVYLWGQCRYGARFERAVFACVWHHRGGAGMGHQSDDDCRTAHGRAAT